MRDEKLVRAAKKVSDAYSKWMLAHAEYNSLVSSENGYGGFTINWNVVDGKKVSKRREPA